jgi:ribosome-associated protein
MPITDYFVLVTGTNPRHVKAMTEEIRKTIKDEHQLIASIEGADVGWWVLLDIGPVVVHLFQETARSYYELDELWADADKVEWKRQA